MKTKKPIATISYNTEKYLDHVLKHLLDCGLIDFFAYVKHFAEGDECGSKNHIHLYLEPSETLETSDLNNLLVEDCIPLPLKSMPFRASNFENWCMYSLHEKNYCRSKGLSKKFSYRIDSMKTNDWDFLYYKYGSIDLIKITPYNVIEEAHNAHLSFDQLVRTGRVPIQHLKAYEFAFYQLLEARKHPSDEDFVYVDPNECTFDEILEAEITADEIDILISGNKKFMKEYERRFNH